MTTVAWDGKTLAADRQITASDRKYCDGTKVRKRKDGALIAVVGGMCVSFEFMRWFMAGEKGTAPSLAKATKGGVSGHVLIVRKNGIVEDHDQDGWHVVEGPIAIGSGGAFATMAMRLGKNATEAVLLASEYDIYSGSGTDTVELGK